MEAPDDDIQRTPAEENIWYQLATIYGVPESADDPIQVQNRITWNRTMATLAERYDPEAKRHLLALERQDWWDEKEIEPFNDLEISKLNIVIRIINNNKSEYTVISFIKIKEINAFFSRLIFAFVTFFDRCEFDKMNFDGSIFIKHSFLCGSKIKNIALFNFAKFISVATISGNTFSGYADFGETQFNEYTRIDNNTFSMAVIFRDSEFLGEADFFNNEFLSSSYFSATRFKLGAIFKGAIFAENADFSQVRFGGETTFVNAKMQDETRFVQAVFESSPPLFFGTTLHEGTTWNRDRSAWPLPMKKEEASQFVAAYERLKLEMDRLKKHEDEMDFFALELQSRRIEMGEYSPYGILIWLYGALSDYGRSYVHPLKWIAAIVLAGFLILLFDAHQPDELLGKFALSAANTFALLGIRREFIDPEVTKALAQNGTLSFIATLQAVAGAFLTFLVGLGLRNKLRMK